MSPSMPVSHSCLIKVPSMTEKTCVSREFSLIWSLSSGFHNCFQLVMNFSQYFVIFPECQLCLIRLIIATWFPCTYNSYFSYVSQIPPTLHQLIHSFHPNVPLVKFNSVTIGLSFMSRTDIMMGPMMGSHYQPYSKISSSSICLSVCFPRPLCIPSASVSFPRKQI